MNYFLHELLFLRQVALVTWTEEVGLALVRRDLNSMTLRNPQGQLINYQILQIFPFTSESKRMGIIVKVRLSSRCTCNLLVRIPHYIDYESIILCMQLLLDTANVTYVHVHFSLVPV